MCIWCGPQTMVHIQTWMLISAANLFFFFPAAQQQDSGEHTTLGLCFSSLGNFGMAGCAITAKCKTGWNKGGGPPSQECFKLKHADGHSQNPKQTRANKTHLKKEKEPPITSTAAARGKEPAPIRHARERQERKGSVTRSRSRRAV